MGSWHKTAKGKAWFQALRVKEMADRKARRERLNPRRKCRQCKGPIPVARPLKVRYCSTRCTNQSHRESPARVRYNARLRKIRAKLQEAVRAKRVCPQCTKPVPKARHIRARFCSRDCCRQASYARAAKKRADCKHSPT